jgi:regulator of nucleoside diphosphate kinase
MKKEQLILTKQDFAFLMECYFSDHISVFNKERLSQELRNAKIVMSECVPSNVVRANSNVLVCNIDKSQTFNIHIVSHDGTNKKSNDIPISDPLAIALLGYQTGAIAEWEMPDGINRFQIVSVHQAYVDPVINPFIA